MSTTVTAPSRPSLFRQLASLVVHPRRTFPDLLERRKPIEVMAFSGVSGIYVAWLAAERLHLGDPLGFVPALICVLAGGAGIGLLALAFTDVVLTGAIQASGGAADRELVTGVFGYATWLFLPLFVVVGIIELATYGGQVFSALRLPAPTISTVVTVLELATLGLWLLLMIEGTAAAGQMGEIDAARTFGYGLARMIIILILLILIAFISFMI